MIFDGFSIIGGFLYFPLSGGAKICNEIVSIDRMKSYQRVSLPNVFCVVVCLLVSFASFDRYYNQIYNLYTQIWMRLRMLLQSVVQTIRKMSTRDAESTSNRSTDSEGSTVLYICRTIIMYYNFAKNI